MSVREEQDRRELREAKYSGVEVWTPHFADEHAVVSRLHWKFIDVGIFFIIPGSQIIGGSGFGADVYSSH